MRVFDASSVFVQVSGTLEQVEVRPGQRVTVVAGEPAPTLAKLANTDIEDKLLELQGRYSQAEEYLKSLEFRRNEDEKIGAQIPAARQTLASIAAQLEEARKEQSHLEIKAPKSGVVIPPPVQTVSASAARLPNWSGIPLEGPNRGCLLNTGDLFCLVGDPRRMEAVLVIDQSDVEFIQPGLRVELKLDALPGDTLTGFIEKVSRSDLDRSPSSLLKKGVRPFRVGEYAAKTATSRGSDPFFNRLLAGFPTRRAASLPPRPPMAWNSH